MNVLVTGGTGLLGHHCAVRLKKLGHEVSILGRNERIGNELQKLGLPYQRVDLLCIGWID